MVLLAAAALPGATSAATAPVPPPSADSTLDGPMPNWIPRPSPGAASPEAAPRLLVNNAPRYLPTGSFFDDATVVAFYGYPGVQALGVLGHGTLEEMADSLDAIAAEYDAANGPRRVIPALHVIVAVAQRTPEADGSYLDRITRDELEPLIELARERAYLVFLDIQIGWADPLEEVRLFEDLLAEPFVHLALDPEFATKGAGAAPGRVIGTLGADDVNAVQDYLAGIVREHRLPPKVLVLHQFVPWMLEGTEDYESHREVEISVDMDGFGGPGIKLDHYAKYALAEYSDRPAIKLFFDWDTPLMSAADVMGLETPPDLVIYH